LQARHLFYGIAMLDKYRGTGRKKWYLIFGMCDESFSINYAVTPPPDVEPGWFMFFVTLLNHAYWVTGATLGGLFGNFITFDIKGLEFVMTALFVVILLEQLLEGIKNLPSVLIGLLVTAAALIFFGASSFLIQSMALILLFLALFSKPISALHKEKGGKEE
jgi:4-azaleucine resistance transporter AzlC